MPKRKRTREVTVKDVRTILRLSCAEGLSVREISDRLRFGKSSVSTYLYRAREAGNCSVRPWNGCRQAHFPR